MKHLTLFFTLLLATVCQAQDYSKMSRYVREQVALSASNAAAKGLTPNALGKKEAMYVFVQAPEEAVEKYCIKHMDDIHICRVPMSDLPTLSMDAKVQRIETNEVEMKTSLDRSASKVNVGQVWEGTALPQAFDGSGTVVGVVDAGYDYSHPTFRSAKDNHLRISRVWDVIDIDETKEYDETSNFPLGKFLSDTTKIKEKAHSFDAEIIYHGTHTSSIAAGSGWDTPYKGMAPEAEIYLTTWGFSDIETFIPKEWTKYFSTTFLALAYQNITDYADSIGKPCVINFSAGHADQDITKEEALYNKYLEKIFSKEGHILVAAAGNRGTQRRYLPKSADVKAVGGLIESNIERFAINISTKQPLKLRIKDFATDSKTEVIPLDFLPGGGSGTSPSGLKWEKRVKSQPIEELGNMVEHIYCGPDGFDDSKVGYDIEFDVDKENPHTYAVEIVGEGVEADIFSKYSDLLPGTEYSPTLCGALPNSGNIDSPAALPSVIAVGAVNHTNTYINYKGENHGFNAGEVGKRAFFSSCGPSIHGFIKPDVSAPGNVITAAVSSFNTQDLEDVDTKTIALTDYDDKQYGWVIASGTSMATPIVTGIIALWLEADPTLTKDDIMDVIAHTSKEPDHALSYPNNEYGYGEIDAYKGLLYILNGTSIEGLSQTHLPKECRVQPTASALLFSFARETATALPVRLYALTGQVLQEAVIPAGVTAYSLPTENLHGIIAVQVGSLGSTLVSYPAQ